MMCHKLCIAVLSACVAGCATINPREAFPMLASDIEMRSGTRIVWRDGGEADRAVDQAIEQLLAREINVEGAVQIALLNNRSIQATYEELGIAQAELVEAGLLSNPIFSALLKFPEGGGDPNIELAISQNFIELLSMPLRKRAASANYDVVKARVAGEVIELASQVRKQFFELQAAEQILMLHQSKLQIAESASLAARQLRAAGNISELQLVRQEAESGKAKLDLMRIESQSMKAREALTTLMGLWGTQTSFKLAGRLPEPPDRENDFHDVELTAIRQSFELQSAVSEIHATRESLGIARQFAWGDLEAGIEAEREGEGNWSVGPGVSVPIPIFNTGAVNVSVARAKLRQAEHRLYALVVRIRSEARAARSELLKARQHFEFYQSTQLPLHQSVVRESQLQYNAMQIGVFELLEAKRAEIETHCAYVESIQDYWIARTELERIIGVQFPPDEQTSTLPATQPGIEAVHRHH